jgi:hypothetical protein
VANPCTANPCLACAPSLQRLRRSSEAIAMRRNLVALACAVLLAAPLSGCFVLDEIDKGDKFLEEHSPPKKGAEEKKDEKAAPVAGKKGAIDAYFRAEEEEGTTKSFAPGEVSEGIVACKLGGATQFMKREDCAARGGQAK